VTGWRQAAAIAEVTGLPLSSHLYPEVSAHLLRVTPTAHWLEWQDWAHPVLARPFEVRDGRCMPPAVAGNGLEWGRGRRSPLSRTFITNDVGRTPPVPLQLALSTTEPAARCV